MSNTPRILVFAGSTRAGSFNRKLARAAAAAATAAGAQVTELELQDHPLPLYDGDLEARGMPDGVLHLKSVFKDHNALLIASPEYNSGVSGVLKNMIDWVSRPVQGEPSLAAFRNKTAGIVSASTGALGGLRGLSQLRWVLSNINVLVLPEQLAISKAESAFGESGTLVDPAQQAKLAALSGRLVEVTRKLMG